LTTIAKYFWDNVNSFQTLQEIFSDFSYAWKKMLYIMAASFGFSLIVVFSMRCLVAPIVYGLLLAAWGSFTVLTIFLIYTWRRLQVGCHAVDVGGVEDASHARGFGHRRNGMTRPLTNATTATSKTCSSSKLQ
jgi:hypothetical protein